MCEILHFYKNNKINNVTVLLGGMCMCANKKYNNKNHFYNYEYNELLSPSAKSF